MGAVTLDKHSKYVVFFVRFMYMSETLIVKLEMDKSWIQCNWLLTKYENGVKQFINFATKTARGSSVITCLCLDCGNISFETPTTVKDNLYMHCFDVKYDNCF